MSPPPHTHTDRKPRDSRINSNKSVTDHRFAFQVLPPSFRNAFYELRTSQTCEVKFFFFLSSCINQFNAVMYTITLCVHLR